jgi:hypothetical protein
MKGLLHSFCLVQLPLVISFGSLIAQAPNEMITRDQYLDKLEERFLDATSELNEISGIKFQVPESSLSQASRAQSSFDNLPGPIQTKSPDLLSDDEIILEIMREETEIEETGVILIEESNETLEEKVLEVKVVPPRYLEDELGRFYIQPFIGLSLISGQMNLAGDALPAVDHDLGYGLGVNYGRRWGNLYGEIHLSHYENDFSGVYAGSVIIDLEGSTYITNLGARLGYNFFLGQKSWIKAATGFGFAERRTIYETKITAGSPISISKGESSSVFSYDFLVAMAYEFSTGWDASITYRFLNVNEYNIYDDISTHLFEVGVARNF